jgi:hypothetical protein
MNMKKQGIMMSPKAYNSLAIESKDIKIDDMPYK